MITIATVSTKNNNSNNQKMLISLKFKIVIIKLNVNNVINN